MKNSIIASKENYGLLFDRFQKFVNRNSDKKFTIKNVWGKPQKSEKWDRKPINHHFKDTPKIEKHLNYGKDECLFGICPQSIDDITSIHYMGNSSLFFRDHSDTNNFAEIKIYTEIIHKGDKIFFKSDGLIVIPKRKDPVIKKICSWMLTAN